MIAIYIDPELSKHNTSINAAIEFLLDTLGYQFRIIYDFDSLIITDTLLYYSPKTPSNELFISFALKHPVILMPFCEEIYNLDKIKKGRIESFKQYINIGSEVPVLHNKKIKEPVTIMSNEHIVTAKYNFDLLGNIMFFLSNLEGEIRADGGGKFPENKSFFYKDFDHAFVAEYLTAFDWVLESILKAKGFYLIKKEMWPKSQNYAFAVTHTVDKLNKWTWGKIFHSLLDIFVLLVTLRLPAFLRQFGSMLNYMFRGVEQYWSFPEYSKLEDDYTLKSSWFFAVNESDLTDYNFLDKDLQNVIITLSKSGHDIALYSFPEQETIEKLFQNEKRLKIASGKGSGVRNDDYMSNSSSLSRAERANLSYDSSYSFKRKFGFFNGFVHPFKPITSKFRSENYTYPVNCNDSALRIEKYKAIMFKQAKVAFKEVLDDVKKYHGLLCLDLKLSNYFETYYQSKLTSYIFEKIKDDNVFIGTLYDINNWWKSRSDVIAFEEEYDLSITFQEDFKNITFSIVGDKRISEITGAEVKINGNKIECTNVTSGSELIVKFSAKK